MRDRLFKAGSKPQQYSRAVMSSVNAKAQAKVYNTLNHEGSILLPGERSIMRWAMNSGTVKAPARVSALEYKKASAVEVLVSPHCCGRYWWSGTTF